MAELTGISSARNGHYVAVQDQQAGRVPFDNVPINIAIIGACEKGRTTTPAIFNNTNIQQASGVFGTKGDMLEQVLEMQQKGISSILALRQGGRSLFLDHIGDTTGTSGYRIECADAGTEWATSYGIAYSTSDGRLMIQDLASAGTPIVFDNLPAAPIDYGLFYITGTPTLGQGTTVGTAASGLTIPLNSATNIDGNMFFYKGDNGTDGISRMEIFENVFRGLQVLENFRYRTFAAPEKATLNCPINTASTATGGTNYPAAESTFDKLGKVFIEDVDGRFEFYWDVDSDNTAEFWSVNATGLSYATQSKGGVNLTTAVFKVPNFAYAIAYEMDRMHQEVRYVDAVVAVEKPGIGRPMSEWFGAPAIYTTDIEGDVTVSTNGSGILGNKYIAGATDFRGASAYGGFIRTTNPFFDDGTEFKDASGNAVDIGKYLVLWGTPEYFTVGNNVRFNRPYYKVSPAAYAAWREGLPLTLTPTMQDYPALSVLTNRIPRAIIDRFAEMRITIAKPTDAGIKILDAPVAALPVSDYARQGTMRTIEFIDRALRIRADRYLGRYLDTQEEQALQQEFTDVMNALIQNRVIKGGVARYFTTPQSRIRGEAFVNVQVVVPFELRKITFSLSLTQG